jgi:heat shock protein HslJ
MKCFSAAATVLFLILLLTGCSNTKSTTELYRIKDSLSKILYQNDWKLTFLYGTKVSSNTTALLSFTPGDSMKVSGHTGCNSLSGHFELPGNAGLTFSSVASTKMACIDDKANKMENSFLEMLPVITRWYIDGDVLTLYSKEHLSATFKAQRKASTNEEMQLNGTWELNYISGPKIAFEGLFPNKKPTLIFNFPNEDASGNGSCNGYNVKVKVDGNTIHFGNALSTMMACEGNGEPVYFKTLKTVTSYSVDENSLTLIMGDIAVMRFSKTIQ